MRWVITIFTIIIIIMFVNTWSMSEYNEMNELKKENLRLEIELKKLQLKDTLKEAQG